MCEEIDPEYAEVKLSPEDLDDLWEIEKRVEAINCYTDFLKMIDTKLTRYDKEVLTAYENPTKSKEIG